MFRYTLCYVIYCFILFYSPFHHRGREINTDLFIFGGGGGGGGGITHFNLLVTPSEKYIHDIFSTTHLFQFIKIRLKNILPETPPLINRLCRKWRVLCAVVLYSRKGCLCQGAIHLKKSCTLNKSQKHKNHKKNHKKILLTFFE